MCGVHTIVLIPSDAAMRAIANDVSRSLATSSIPGSKWQCRSINLPPHLSSLLACTSVPNCKAPRAWRAKLLGCLACHLVDHCGISNGPQWEMSQTYVPGWESEVVWQLRNTMSPSSAPSAHPERSRDRIERSRLAHLIYYVTVLQPELRSFEFGPACTARAVHWA